MYRKTYQSAYVTFHEKGTALLSAMSIVYVNNKGADQGVHPHNLISIIIICYLYNC